MTSRNGIEPADRCSTGKSQLASEMFVPADDFEMYNVYFSPITIGFFLREFNVSAHLLSDVFMK